MSVTDGPYAETKEQLGGFFLISARDLNEAIQVASKFPSVRFGTMEVRPVREIPGSGTRRLLHKGSSLKSPQSVERRNQSWELIPFGFIACFVQHQNGSIGHFSMRMPW